MNPVQKLHFVVPSAQPFIDAMCALPTSSQVMLVGEGTLADEVASMAATQGLSLQQRTDLPDTASLATQRTLVFTERDGERLGELLLACLDLTDVTVIAPVTERHFSCMPLFVVSIPKAGTHLLYELASALGYAEGIELTSNPQPKTWYCLEYSNSHTVARDFFVDTVRRSPFGNRHHPFTTSPVLFGYRHPLDILVSEANYYHKAGKTVFSGYFEKQGFKERVDQLANDDWLLGSLRERVGGFLPWLKFPNVLPVSFEELIGSLGGGSDEEQQKAVWSMMLKLQVDGSSYEIGRKVFNKGSATFNEGKIGSYKTKLTANQLKSLESQCSDIISQFGYTDSNSLVPSTSKIYRSRPLIYSNADYDKLPLTIETNFIGFNLVKFNKRFYAIPQDAKKVNLEKLDADELSVFPSEEDLVSLKTLLTVGIDKYKNIEHQRALLASRISTSNNELTDSYWTPPNPIQLVDAYNGFNIVRLNDRYVAINQAIGFVDLSLELNLLIDKFSLNDFMVADSPAQLKLDIDSVSQSSRSIAYFRDRIVDTARLVEEERQRAQEGLNALEVEIRESIHEVQSTTNSAVQDLESWVRESIHVLAVGQSEAEARLADRIGDTVRMVEEERLRFQASLSALELKIELAHKNLVQVQFQNQEKLLTRVQCEVDSINKRTLERLQRIDKATELMAADIESRLIRLKDGQDYIYNYLNKNPIIIFGLWLRSFFRFKSNSKE